MDLAQILQRAWLGRSPLVWALWPLSLLMRALVAARRASYAAGWLRAESAGVPVVVVGNLIAGGAGKTPTVLALVEWLRRRGHRPGIVSRGHGRRSDALLHVTPDSTAADGGDEPLLLALRSGAPVVVGRDRVAAARALCAAHPDVDVVVADDGLQHLRLQREAQVIVFDERGAGNGLLLPAGPLREPMPRRVPPRSVVLYNAAAPTTPLPGWTAARRLRGAVALADWWRGEPAREAVLIALRGRPVVAAAGVAHPQRFFTMLRDAGLDIVECPRPDHDPYATLPWPAGTADVVLTEKDAVKLAPERVGATRVWVATLDFVLAPAFCNALERLLPAAPVPPPSRPR